MSAHFFLCALFPGKVSIVTLRHGIRQKSSLSLLLHSFSTQSVVFSWQLHARLRHWWWLSVWMWFRCLNQTKTMHEFSSDPLRPTGNRYSSCWDFINNLLSDHCRNRKRGGKKIPFTFWFILHVGHCCCSVQCKYIYIFWESLEIWWEFSQG